jgi:hypothetical protein
MSLAGREGVVIVHRHRYYAWLAFSFARGRFIAERHEERIGAGRDELRQQPRRRDHGPWLSIVNPAYHARSPQAGRAQILPRAHALLVRLLAYYVELKPGVRKAILGPHPSDSEALRSMSMAACSDPSGKFCCVLWFRAVRFGRCTF